MRVEGTQCVFGAHCSQVSITHRPSLPPRCKPTTFHSASLRIGAPVRVWHGVLQPTWKGVYLCVSCLQLKLVCVFCPRETSSFHTLSRKLPLPSTHMVSFTSLGLVPPLSLAAAVATAAAAAAAFPLQQTACLACNTNRSVLCFDFKQSY